MDDFNFEFTSQENQFIFKFGVNKGYIQFCNKVNKCLFLSCGAKQLYCVLYSYVINEGNFPNQAMLSLELGVNKNTFYRYLNELENFKFIEKKIDNKNKFLTYLINEVQNIPLIVHSELIYKFIKNNEIINDNLLNKMITALNKYKTSDLFKEVMSNENILNYEDVISDYLYNEVFGVPNKHLKEEVLKQIDVPPVWYLDNVEKEGEEKSKKQKVKSYKDTPINEWNVNHFCYYFSDKYKEKFEMPYVITNADRGALKRLLKERSNQEIMKNYLDTFLEQDCFNVKTIKGFTSSFVQSSLDNFFKTGNLPFYKKGTVKVDNEWLNDINKKDLFNGGTFNDTL